MKPGLVLEKQLIVVPEPFAGQEFGALLRLAAHTAHAAAALLLLSDGRGVWLQASLGIREGFTPDTAFLFQLLAAVRTTLFDGTSEPDRRLDGLLPDKAQFCVAVPFGNRGGELRGLLLVADHTPILASAEVIAAVENSAEAAAGLIDVIEQLHEQRNAARLDGLTGLANRAMFDQRLQAASTADPPECAILCLDFDRFKQVNDVHGHAAGDELLQQMADRIRRVVGQSALAARLGGDEFALLVEGPDAAARAAALGRAINIRAREPFQLQNTTLSVGISMGMALCPEDSADWRTLVRCADAALYRAKRSGRRHLQRYEPRLDAPFIQRTDLDPDLRRALARDELRVYWQKRVFAETGQTHRREALLRWLRPGHGVMLPDRFVPGAESSGTVALLDRFALREACRQAVSWPASIGIAVNISPRWFRRGNLVRTVRDALADSGLDPARLQLEVTEKVLMTDADPVLRAMERLKKLGVGLGLDDFGTAYSSLAYLARFPFDTIKLDRSFVARICEDPRSLAIGRAIIQVGRALEMTICAEGIETTHQRDLLLIEGVDEFQGFLFGRPVPVPD